MSALAEFGPLVIPTDVDEAVIELVATWLNTYLSQAELERGLPNGHLARPRRSNITNVLTTAEWMDNALPAVVVTTANTTATPIVTARRDCFAFWRVTVQCVVRGKTMPLTKQIASLYEGSVRRLMLQQAVRSDLIDDCRWVATNPVAPVPDTSGAGRWLASGINAFDVGTDAAVNGDFGPTVPDVGPYSPLATVEEVEIDLETLTTGDR
jgi:hypothetical protein